MVTASTFRRQRFLHSHDRLNLVTFMLIHSASRFGWTLRAWAVLSNHYHFIAQSPQDSGVSLKPWLSAFHRATATILNRLDASLSPVTSKCTTCGHFRVHHFGASCSYGIVWSMASGMGRFSGW
jgi:REP element-mobilizing transposase RayT